MHVVQRGNNRGACFFLPQDRDFYLSHLKELSEKFNCAIHAYVLMTNHVHLLVTPEDTDSVSLLMKHLGQRYVQHINRAYKRTGGMWEGRYRASFVDREYYLMCCYRYIELNPVRAGIVQHPADYLWSSYLANAEGLPSELVTPHSVYQLLGRTPMERHEAYRGLFASELGDKVVEEIRLRTKSGFAIGNEDFIRQAELACGRRVSPAKRGGTSPNGKKGVRPL